ncbi:hypothetical protein ACXPWS_07690 [Mycobacterium sp. BMJ-28]
MPKEVVAALIAVAGVILTQFVTYTISRQSARDLRVSIGREIDIVKNLVPESSEAQQLERHIADSIAKLIARDENRERLLGALASAAPLPILATTAWGAAFWLQHDPPDGLKPALYVALASVTGVLIAQFVVYLFRTTQLAYLITKLWIFGLRNRWKLMRRIKRNERRLASSRKAKRALQEYVAKLEGQPLDDERRRNLESFKQALAEGDEAHAEVADELASIKRDLSAARPVRLFIEEYRKAGSERPALSTDSLADHRHLVLRPDSIGEKSRQADDLVSDPVD